MLIQLVDDSGHVGSQHCNHTSGRADLTWNYRDLESSSLSLLLSASVGL